MPSEKPILSVDVIQHPRTPSELRAFAQTVRTRADATTAERHKGMLKKGLYKEFVDEIIPLSHFVDLRYSDDVKVHCVLGNQGYDALILDGDENISGKIEITAPHDGSERIHDAKLAVARGYGETHCYGPGEEIAKLSKLILVAAKKKAAKDYTDSVLVFAFNILPPVKEFRQAHECQILLLIEQLRALSYRAKEVWLLDVSHPRIFNILGKGI